MDNHNKIITQVANNVFFAYGISPKRKIEDLAVCQRKCVTLRMAYSYIISNGKNHSTKYQYNNYRRQWG